MTWPRWSPEEKALLRIRVRTGHLASEISWEIGRTPAAVMRQAYQLGLRWPQRETRAPWTEARRAKTLATMAATFAARRAERAALT